MHLRILNISEECTACPFGQITDITKTVFLCSDIESTHTM